MKSGGVLIISGVILRCTSGVTDDDDTGVCGVGSLPVVVELVNASML